MIWDAKGLTSDVSVMCWCCGYLPRRGPISPEHFLANNPILRKYALLWYEKWLIKQVSNTNEYRPDLMKDDFNLSGAEVLIFHEEKVNYPASSAQTPCVTITMTS